MRRITRRRGRAAESDPYWISFTDLLTAVLFVFILATLAFMAQVGQKQAELNDLETELTARIDSLEAQRSSIGTQVERLSDAEDVRAQIFAELKVELARLGIQVEVNADQSVLSIPSEALGFASGKFDIAPNYQERAIRIGEALHTVVTAEGRAEHLDTVFIEGHTDGRPFSGPLGMDNWGLSSFRAISLWQLWEARLSPGTRLGATLNGAGKNLFSVSGYADTRPLTGLPASDADIPENRRIDIRITIVRPSSEDLSSILTTTGEETQ